VNSGYEIIDETLNSMESIEHMRLSFFESKVDNARDSLFRIIGCAASFLIVDSINPYAEPIEMTASLCNQLQYVMREDVSLIYLPFLMKMSVLDFIQDENYGL